MKTEITTTVPPAFATITDWSAMTGMSRSSIYEQLPAGNLIGRKLGKRTLIDCDSGFAWLRGLPAPRFVRETTES